MIYVMLYSYMKIIQYFVIKKNILHMIQNMFVNIVYLTSRCLDYFKNSFQTIIFRAVLFVTQILHIHENIDPDYYTMTICSLTIGYLLTNQLSQIQGRHIGYELSNTNCFTNFIFNYGRV